MKTRSQILFFFSLILGGCFAHAQVTLTGGKGILRLYEAESVTAGDFYVNPYASFYATPRQDTDINILAKDNTLNLGLTLGISRVFETFIHFTPYQTDQVNLWGAPGDSKVGLKANIPAARVSQFGVLTFLDIPTGDVHPVPYEPFSENNYGYAIIGLVSFDLRKAASPLPLKAIVNLGYRSHNSSKGFMSGDTDQLVGGLGLKWAIKSSQLYTEISGEVFTNNPAVNFSQNSLRWSGGYKFLLRGGIIFDIATDIELGGYKPTEAEIDQTPRFFEDYADWKVILGLTYRWTFFPNWDKQRQTRLKQKQQQEKDEEKIREQREKVIEELEEYQKRLQDEKKKNVPF